MAHIRTYGYSTYIYFPLLKAGTKDFATGSDYTPAAGDVKISLAGGTASNTAHLPSAVTMGNGAMWALQLDSAELEAESIVITIIDAPTKAVEDQMLVIETYGAYGELNPYFFANAMLDVNLGDGVDSGGSTLRNAARAIVNKWEVSGTTLTVYKEDGTTVAYTTTLSTASGADSVTGSTPA